MKSLAWFLLFLLAAGGRAQVASSSLRGTVRDVSGSVVSGAEVKARHNLTGFTRSARTSYDGRYRVDELIPGLYTVSVSGAGFRTSVSRDMLLTVHQAGTLDVVLELGTRPESITVTARVSPLRTEDASAGYHLPERAIRGLPP